MLQRYEKFLSLLIAKQRSSSAIMLQKKTLKLKYQYFPLVAFLSTKCIGKGNIQELRTSAVVTFGEVRMMQS